MTKPKYKVGTSIWGRTNHIGKNLPNQIVLIEIESAHYDSVYGHWIYAGDAGHEESEDGFGLIVEIYDHDVIGRVK